MLSLETRKKISNQLLAGVLAASAGGAVAGGFSGYHAYNDLKVAEESIEALEFYKDAGDPMLSEEYEARVEFADKKRDDLIFHLGSGAAFAAIGLGAIASRSRREETTLE